ncbi:unnamed protein product [Amoebophrya sp. A25]|nr:unnamed protein product [Amoebophrya sp. A25]|eukprot:GSA25T00008497001.1
MKTVALKTIDDASRRAQPVTIQSALATRNKAAAPLRGN